MKKPSFGVAFFVGYDGMIEGVNDGCPLLSESKSLFLLQHNFAVKDFICGFQ